jgi:hypothetical protein
VPLSIVAAVALWFVLWRAQGARIDQMLQSERESPAAASGEKPR